MLSVKVDKADPTDLYFEELSGVDRSSAEEMIRAAREARVPIQYLCRGRSARTRSDPNLTQTPNETCTGPCALRQSFPGAKPSDGLEPSTRSLPRRGRHPRAQWVPSGTSPWACGVTRATDLRNVTLRRKRHARRSSTANPRIVVRGLFDERQVVTSLDHRA